MLVWIQIHFKCLYNKPEKRKNKANVSLSVQKMPCGLNISGWMVVNSASKSMRLRLTGFVYSNWYWKRENWLFELSIRENGFIDIRINIVGSNGNISSFTTYSNNTKNTSSNNKSHRHSHLFDYFPIDVEYLQWPIRWNIDNPCVQWWTNADIPGTAANLIIGHWYNNESGG